MNEITGWIEQALGVKVNVGVFLLTSVALNWLGTRVKKVPSIPDELIPVILALVGAVFYVVCATCLEGFHPPQIVIGIVAGGFAVGAHQGVRNIGYLTSGPTQPPVEQKASNDNKASTP